MIRIYVRPRRFIGVSRDDRTRVEPNHVSTSTPITRSTNSTHIRYKSFLFHMTIENIVAFRLLATCPGSSCVAPSAPLAHRKKKHRNEREREREIMIRTSTHVSILCCRRGLFGSRLCTSVRIGNGHRTRYRLRCRHYL